MRQPSVVVQVLKPALVATVLVSYVVAYPGATRAPPV
jgi:hypothetical protein